MERLFLCGQFIFICIQIPTFIFYCMINHCWNIIRVVFVNITSPLKISCETDPNQCFEVDQTAFSEKFMLHVISVFRKHNLSALHCASPHQKKLWPELVPMFFFLNVRRQSYQKDVRVNPWRHWMFRRGIKLLNFRVQVSNLAVDVLDFKTSQ